MSKSAEENKKKHEALKRELEDATKLLSQVEQESGKDSKAYQDLARYVSTLTTDYNKSAKAVDEQEQALSKARVEINKANTDYNTTKKTLDGLNTVTDEASADTKELGKDVKESGDNADKAAKGGFTVLKGALANLAAEAIKAIPQALINGVKELGSAFGSAAVSAAEFGDSIAKSARNANLSFSGFQEWSYILDQNGASIDGLKNAMLNLEKASENGSDALAELGFTQEQLNAMSPEETFNAVITALQGVEDEGRRSVLAAQLLGKSFGTDLGSLLDSTAEETEALRERVHDLGMVMTDEAIQNSETFGDALDDLKGTLNGLKNNIFAEFLPSLTEVMQGLTDVFSNKDAEGGLAKISEGVTAFSQKILEIAPKFLNLASGIITNLIGSLAKIAPMLIQTVGQLISSTLPIIVTLLQDGLPVIIQAVESILSSLADVIPQLIPIIFDAVSLILTDLCAWLSEEGNVSNLLSGILALAVDLTNKFAELLPILLPAVFQVIAELADFLTKPENIEMLINSTVFVIGKICEALIASLPNILHIFENLGYNLVSGIVNTFGKVKELFSMLWSWVKSSLSNWISNARNTLNTAKNNFLNKVNEIKTKISSFVLNVIEKVKEIPSKVVSIGKDLVTGLWNGINDKITWVKDKIKGMGSAITNAIKSVFGIASPSKVTKKLGGYLAEGLGLGFTEEMRDVREDINNALPTFDMPTTTSASGLTSTGGLDYYTMVNAFKEALTGVNVELDDQKVGKFVKKTVSDAIYYT